MKRGLLASYALLFAGFTLISLSAGSSIVTGNAVFNETSGSIASVAGLAFIGAAIGLFLGEGGLEQKFDLDPNDPSDKALRRKMEKVYKKTGNDDLKKQIDKGNAYDLNNHEYKRHWGKFKELVGQQEGLEGKRKEPKGYSWKDIYGFDPRKTTISQDAYDRAINDDNVWQNLNTYVTEIGKILQDPIKNRKSHPIGEFKVHKPSSPGKSGSGRPERIAYHIEAGKMIIDDLLYHDDENYVDNWDIKAGKGHIKIKDYKDKGYTNLSDLVRKASS